MLNPIRLVNDLFEDRQLSDANLRSFTEDHLSRLAQPENNPGSIYSALISATTTKYTNYYGKISTEASRKAIAEGTTVTRNNARKATEEKISQLQGLVKFKFGETSAIYQEFFPLGVTEYIEAREGDVGTLFDRFVTTATTHLTADYPAEVTAMTTLVTAFHNSYAARETAVAQVDATGTGKNADRKTLTLQLTTNFLTIALNNLENTDKFDDYFDPAYLPISDSPDTFNGIIAPNTIINAVSETYLSGSSNLQLENRGSVPLVFSLSETSGTINPAISITIEPGQTQNFGESLPTLPRYFLNIQNQSPDQSGKWHVQVS